MSDPVDDLDVLLRGAMATLDREAPADYFDSLASRTMARLDAAPAPDVPGHAVAALADPVDERIDEQIDELARERALRGPGAPASNDAAVTAPAPGAAPAGGPIVANRRRLVAILGIGLAAAAGAMIFVSTQGRDEAGDTRVVMHASDSAEAVGAPARSPSVAPGGHGVAMKHDPAPDPAPAGAMAPVPAPAPPATAGRASSADDSTRGGAGAGLRLGKPPAKAAKGKGAPVLGDNAGKRGRGKLEITLPLDGNDGNDGAFSGKLTKLPAPAKPSQGAAAGSADDRQALSVDDIKRGMTAVAAPVQACVTERQGQVSVRLTVLPSGKVARVTVSGRFAGTPVADCVERAVRSATFPPWAGKPQRFDFSYVLSGPP